MFRKISWNVKGLRSPQKTYENSQTSKATKTRYCLSPGDAFTQRRFFKIAKTLGVSSVWLAGSRQTGWGVDSNNKHNNKAPGPDGYTGEFFKTLREQVSPTLLDLFNSILCGNTIPPSASMAYIQVLPKAGKDASLPGSFRPISLIHQDIKILSKMMAERISKILPVLISPAHLGFIKGNKYKKGPNSTR